MNSTETNALSDHPHRRFNPLTGQWVLVSPHRAKRPWSGASEDVKPPKSISYVEDCFLCAGNTRVNGETNPDYKGPFIFKNDFGALNADTPEFSSDDDVFKYHSVQGEARVMCFSEDHSKTLPQLTKEEVVEIVKVWQEQYKELSPSYPWVQIFENKGEAMGCSQPHPHGQIWTNSFLPNEIERKNTQLHKLYEEKGENFLLHYALLESKDGTRTVFENDSWIAVVPFWAAWPFEAMILPKFKCARMEDANEVQSVELAEALRELTIRYDNLFECSFPYSMGWHQAPYLDSVNKDAWQVHALFYPPLLRSASVKKFMVGYEMMAESQRDLTPEQAAERLQKLSSTHYSENI